MNMHFNRRILCKFIFIVAVIIMTASPTRFHAAADKPPENPFGSLQKRLIRDGFDKAVIDKMFGVDRISFDAEGVSLFLMHRESTLNYDQFTTPENIQKARAYMETHKTELTNAQKAYGVDKHVITAIILVETRLGTYLGTRYVFNTLSSMAAITDPALREKIWSEIPTEKRYPKKQFEKRADQKAKWAYGELKALIRYADREKIDLSNLKGSYAGALGVAQFMPTSLMAYAKDGNNDGRIDLYTHADSIASIASYLKSYGWKPGIGNDKAYKVVYQYNRSKYYVSTVLKIADMLKGER